MKIELIEGDENFLFQITAETAKEVSQLSRLALSFKKVPVEISTVFPRESDPICEIVVIKKNDFNPWV